MTGVRFTTLACPVQAVGTTTDGRAWYFRYRWGRWALSVSEPGGTVDDAVTANVEDRYVAVGYVGTDLDGFMDEAVAEAIIREHLDVA